MATEFSATSPISRPSDNTKKRESIRSMGGLSFDIKWGMFVPFDEDLVAIEQPHPEELMSQNGSVSDLTNQRTA